MARLQSECSDKLRAIVERLAKEKGLSVSDFILDVVTREVLDSGISLGANCNHCGSTGFRKGKPCPYCWYAPGLTDKRKRDTANGHRK